MTDLFSLIEGDNLEGFTKLLTETKDPNKQNPSGVFFFFI
jgi:hypothetical protein